MCVLQIVSRTDVGLGEAYMAGDYLVDDLGAFMALMVRRNTAGWAGCDEGVKLHVGTNESRVCRPPFTFAPTRHCGELPPAVVATLLLCDCCRWPTLASWRAARARWVW